MKDYKKAITEFYTTYNPEQLDRVDYLLKKYKGREEELLNSLEKKYIGVTKTEKSGKTGKVKREEEKEKQPKKEAASTQKITAKKEESKSDWEKRREEILRQVRERSESLKKKRESNQAKSQDAEKTEVLSSFQETQNSEIINDVNEYEKTEVIEPLSPSDYDKTEILETASVGNDATEVIESPTPAATKRTRSVARYSEEEIKPKLRIPNPGSMTAAQRAAFWAEQLEVKEQLRLRRMSEKALYTKYEEPEPEPPKKERKAISQAKPVTEKKKPVKTEGKKSSGKILWIGLIALLLGGAGYVAWKSGVFGPKEIATTEEVAGSDEKPVKKTAISPEGAREFEAEGDENGDVSDDKNDSGFALSDNEDDEERIEPSDVDKTEPPSKENISPTNSGKLTTPCFLVSYATLSSEDGAMSSASGLRNKGFAAGYYFIPDYIPGGKSLYKVYAGPFTTAEDAEATAERIRPFSEGAYVIYLQ